MFASHPSINYFMVGEGEIVTSIIAFPPPLHLQKSILNVLKESLSPPDKNQPGKPRRLAEEKEEENEHQRPVFLLWTLDVKKKKSVFKNSKTEDPY